MNNNKLTTVNTDVSEARTTYQMKAYDPDNSLKLFDVAEKLFQSGMYPQVKNAAGAFVIIQYGAELGLGPMQSLQMISIIGGKPSCDAKLLLALMKRDGWNYKIIRSDDKECKIQFKKNSQEHIISYTIEEAKEAQLTSKDIWKKYKSDMLFSRCASRASRRLSPETTLGIYTTEEVESFTDNDPEPDNDPDPENDSDPDNDPEPENTTVEQNETLEENEKDNTIVHQFIGVVKKRNIVEKLKNNQIVFDDNDALVNHVNNWLFSKGKRFTLSFIQYLNTDEGEERFVLEFSKFMASKQNQEEQHEN